MASLKDLTGKKFGAWNVISRAPNKNNLVYWHCKCDCGTERDVRSASLIKGISTNCGCKRKQTLSQIRLIDISGQRFGKLIVLEYDRNQSKWKCQCDCGNITYVTSDCLKSKHTKSCGCLKYDFAQSKIKDLTNHRFGKLIALEIVEHKPIKWKCKCDCGNETIVNGSSLIQGLTQSCGCLKSKGEGKIIQLLKENNISFEYQKFFDTCVFDTKNKARFDFYINNKYIIEYDGEQHFGYTKSGWNTEEHFKKLKARDEYKNKWCRENHIPIIRIPYTQYDNLSIKDLLLETSSFIIE